MLWENEKKQGTENSILQSSAIKVTLIHKGEIVKRTFENTISCYKVEVDPETMQPTK